MPASVRPTLQACQFPRVVPAAPRHPAAMLRRQAGERCRLALAEVIEHGPTVRTHAATVQMMDGHNDSSISMQAAKACPYWL
jgi:hypothetical protein